MILTLINTPIVKWKWCNLHCSQMAWEASKQSPIHWCDVIIGKWYFLVAELNSRILTLTLPHPPLTHEPEPSPPHSENTQIENIPVKWTFLPHWCEMLNFPNRSTIAYGCVPCILVASWKYSYRDFPFITYSDPGDRVNLCAFLPSNIMK